MTQRTPGRFKGPEVGKGRSERREQAGEAVEGGRGEEEGGRGQEEGGRGWRGACGAQVPPGLRNPASLSQTLIYISLF